jgi:hypothetical protein
MKRCAGIFDGGANFLELYRKNYQKVATQAHRPPLLGLRGGSLVG